MNRIAGLATAGFVGLLLLTSCGTAPSSPAGTAERTTAGATATIAATATGVAAATPDVTAPAATATAPRAEGPASHDGERTLAHIKQLAGVIGPRVSGSSEEQATVSYIRHQFEVYGYTVETMNFEFQGDRFKPATIRTGSATLEALSLAGSKGGSASGRAVYAGLADAAGIAGKPLAGAIAVADRGGLRFAEKYDNVRAAGAIGLVIVNNQAGMFSGDLQKPAVFPVVTTAQAAGDALKSAAAAGETITIVAPTPTTTASVDVIARAGPEAKCDIIVGGHHDTVASAPGANDNASGAATVVELARAFAADGLDPGLCFVTFGAEESGLYGSSALVERLRREGTLPRLMVNLDVTGYGTAVAVIGSAGPVQRAIALAAQMGIPAGAADLPAGSTSDHQVFREAGVPVVFFTSGEFPTIHSPADVVADIGVSELDRVGDLAYATIADALGQVAQR